MKKLLLTATAAMLLSACSNQLSDVNHKWCPPEVELKNEKIALSADALFKFDKSGSSDLLAEGRKTLDDLINKIRNGYAKIETIDLVGHTDRLGSEEYNYNLGLKRAETVKNYLQQGGIEAEITVASAGESQPVTTHCVSNKASAELTACLQPDRRVTVEIKGVKTGK